MVSEETVHAEEVERANQLSLIARSYNLLLVPGKPSPPPALNPDGSLAEPTANKFCATGKGGGVDPTCGKDDVGGGSGAETVSVKALSVGIGDKVMVDGIAETVTDIKKTPFGIKFKYASGGESSVTGTTDVDVVKDTAHLNPVAPAPALPGDLPDPSSVKVIAQLPGSTHPQLVEDADGKKWVMKTGGPKGHIESEVAADDAYRALGVAVPKSGIVQGPNGPVKFSEFIEGGETLASWRSGKSADQIAAMHKQIGQHFVADAVLANWDVIGQGANNILIKDGKPYRIDNGGALEFRAQGSQKGAAFGNEAKEITTLRSSLTNPDAAKVFKEVSQADINAQIKDVTSKKEALLKALPEHLRDKMEKRIDSLQKQAVDVPNQPVKSKSKDQDGAPITHGKLLSKGEKAKLDLVNPKGIVGNKMNVPSKLGADKIKELEVLHPGVKLVKVKTAGILKGSKKEELLAKLGLSSQAEAEAAIAATVGKKGKSKTADPTLTDASGSTKQIAAANWDATSGKLSATEKSIVKAYTGSAYISLNSAMRECPPDFKCVGGSTKAKMENLQSALDKAPKFAKPITLSRGMDIHSSKTAAAYLQMMKDHAGKGTDYSFPSFTSTSIKSGFSGNFKYKITAKSGLYVKPISHYAHEEEVIVSPTTKYKVLKVEQTTGKYGGVSHMIHLEEV